MPARSATARSFLSVVAIILASSLLAGCSGDAGWKGAGPPAATSLASAPVLSLHQRVRGRFDTGQSLYLRVDPSARNRFEYAIDAVGAFDVARVLTSGKRELVTTAASYSSDKPSWVPAWLAGAASWGQGGQLGDIEYFVITPRSGAGAYEFTVYEGPQGYRP